MIPLKDNLRYSKFAWVSVTIFALNVLMYIGQMTLDTSGTLQTTISSWLPVRDVLTTAIADGDPWLIGRSIAAVFLGMFLHGSFSHIFGNMWFFFCFAPALEARMGHGRFAVFYLVSGVMATLAFLATDMTGTGHILGASGAIGGVLGAYVLYFPRARVDGLTPSFNLISTLSIFFLGEYMLMQWFMIWHQLGGAEEAAGVAFSAHIGGMAFGMLVAALMLVYDVGRFRLRDKVFYLVALAAAVLAFVQPVGGVSPWLWHAITTSGLFVIWLAFFQKSVSGWWKRLGTPVVTMAVAYSTVLGVQLAVAAFQRNNGFIQSLNFYGVAMIVMVATVIIAIAARRLPVMAKTNVTVPMPKTEDRLLSEVAADLVVGFFRWVSALIVAGFCLAAVACRYVGGWLRLALAAIASVYVRFTPPGLQAKLARLAAGIAALSSGTVHLIASNRVARRLFHSYDRLRNRLAVTGV